MTPEPAVEPGGPLDVVTAGEALVSFRANGPLRVGMACTMHVAGAESNVAIALARLGHRAGWAGQVPDDAWGAFVAQTLRAEGVEVLVPAYADDFPGRQGIMLLHQRTPDAARVVYAREGSTGSRVPAEPAMRAVRDGARWLHVSGVTPALSAPSAGVVRGLVETASRAGTRVCLDVNYRARLWSPADARATLRPLVPFLDVLVASEDELGIVVDGSGRPGAEAENESSLVEDALSQGCGRVVVKRGAAGASLFTSRGRLDAPALPVTVVDVVGAGDAFTAGFLSGLLDGLDEAGCLHRATTLGAFAVSTTGDWEGLPRRDELGLLAALDPTRPGDVSR